MTDPEPQTDPKDAPNAAEGEPAGYNTPIDDPHHYDFKNADVPLNPDEDTPPTHRQHEGGYQMDE